MTDPERPALPLTVYGGNVLRDAHGAIVLGAQYQSHCPKPGPVYDGTGYSRMSKALQQGQAAVHAALDATPEAVNEISTGGATPLHMCGMSRPGQLLTAHIIARGGDIEAKDTYGFTPLHRMASNNLAAGARALLVAGADLNASVEGATPLVVAIQSDAKDVVKVLKEFIR